MVAWGCECDRLAVDVSSPLVALVASVASNALNAYLHMTGTPILRGCNPTCHNIPTTYTTYMYQQGSRQASSRQVYSVGREMWDI